MNAKIKEERDRAKVRGLENTLPSEIIAFAYGHTECWLEVLAQSVGCFKRELTDGVATLLQSQGAWFGEGLREVRGQAASMDQRLRKVAMGRGTRGKLSGKATPKGKVTSGVAGYWGRMTKEERLKEMKERAKKGLGKKGSKARAIERKPRTSRIVTCSVPGCGQQVSNVQMGNHMRWKHPDVIASRKTEAAA